jgi:leucyl aminopeptidase
MINISIAKKANNKKSTLFISPKANQLKNDALTSKQQAYLLKLEEGDFKSLNLVSRHIFSANIKKADVEYKTIEAYRRLGNTIFNQVNGLKIEELQLDLNNLTDKNASALIEGLLMSSYQFLKYFSDADKKQNTFIKVGAITKLSSEEVNTIANLIEGVFVAKDLVNEPVNFLTAEQLSKEVEKLTEDGIKVEVFKKKKIESLKMGGLLAVNRGATNPPTFNILEWKPKNAKNKKPIVLVGKGVVYDTGGANIKTGEFMTGMKADMGGAAAVVGAMKALAANKVPQHVIALIPSTENRINGIEYVSGDVITMYSGKTVEVINTDAEGRMILADALAYAQKYDPMLVMDFATLTGAAYRAIGQEGIVYMGSANDKTKKAFEKSGYNCYERLVEFPLWDEYGEQIKSTVADITNLGGPTGGAITAGKFLEHFTDYPWLHFDIAATAYINKKDNYRGNGATGSGVRLVHDFISNLA